MAITVKEIYVKTTVERRDKEGKITDEELVRLRQRIVKEILIKQKRQLNWEKER